MMMQNKGCQYLRIVGRIAAILLAAAPVAFGNSLAVSTDRFSYEGSVTVFASLTDYTNNAGGAVHAIPSFTAGSTTYDGRDLGIFVVQDYANYYADSNIFLTAWYYTISPNGAGWGNPNNTNTGFIQMYDANSSTDTSLTGGWTSLNQFVLSLTGANADYANDSARFWPAPTVGGAGSLSDGTFLSYELSLTANFANSATLNGDGLYELNEDPTSVAGTLSGVFVNPDDGRVFVFDYTLSMDSWVYDQDLANSLQGPYPYVEGYFAGELLAPVPEPATVTLMGLGLAGIAMVRGFRSRVEKK